MKSDDSGELVNIAFDAPQACQDVALIGRIPGLFTERDRAMLAHPCGRTAMLAVLFFLARHDPGELARLP